MKNILIIGANSAIARATARLYAATGNNFYLVARNSNQLNLLKVDLQSRGAVDVATFCTSFDQNSDFNTIIQDACESLGSIDICLIAHGILPNQQECERSTEKALESIEVNGIVTIALLTEVANKMETQGKGTIAVITSVAGDRGRQSNYVYGTSKAMVSTFLQGLRNRLYKSGVNVIDIKPGFVDTPMTSDFKKGLLWSQPETIASDIEKAIRKRRSTVYTPLFWCLILMVIRLIPEPVFKRLKL